jgi:hypothetical protein
MASPRAVEIDIDHMEGSEIMPAFLGKLLWVAAEAAIATLAAKITVEILDEELS